MKISAKMKKECDIVTEESAVVIVSNYEKAVIKNIKYMAPMSNPDNFNFYAEIYTHDGTLMLSSTLDDCVERLAKVAYLKKKFGF